MTLEIATAVSVEREQLAKCLHAYVVNDLDIDSDDVRMMAYSDGTINTQLASGIGIDGEPEVRTLGLPYGRSAHTGSYSDAPRLSIDVHEAYAAAVNRATARREALALLEGLFAEMEQWEIDK
ncbi:hypothetical protein [Natrinema sp. 74]|uniref:hypothetical protein n=1 Tax=Natrinema sp. 74 TaxID=3384159 RepID=UPI0038D3B80D